MNKATRMLTMLGMGLVAGATIGAGPAVAADSTSPAPKASTATKAQQHDRDRDRVVGFYRSLRACEFAGRIGERFDKWDDYDCERVRFGFRRGFWALEVEQDRWGHGGGHWNRPGHGHWNRPGHGHGHFGDRDGRFGDRDGRFGDRDGRFGHGR